ncbi:MAG: hypothetical protein ACI8W9_002120 [Psychromonas sp.]
MFCDLNQATLNRSNIIQIVWKLIPENIPKNTI